MACTIRFVQINFCTKCAGRYMARLFSTEALHEIKNISVENEFEDSEYSDEEILYPNHIPTTWLQKGLLAVGSGFAAFLDPKRDDMIAVLGESTGYLALKRIRRSMQLNDEGQQILREQPRINTSTIDVPSLRELPEGTFGKEYTKFLAKNRVTPDTRLPVRFVDDPELAYIMQRYREIHDFTHTLLGMPTNIIGEITVKWFEMVQTGLPMCTFGSLLAPLRLKRSQQERLARIYIPWAVYTGYRASFFMNLYVEKHFNEPLDSLRNKLNVIPPPIIPRGNR
ncbi:ubiquinone biosynthesis protein COQ4 homolog, mitochondrial-like [Dendronephthya gigantea]|uniref:ubiquinone biosynthesis protein COQ4 homolog, mitochondrial-like n=1 Tax=Dendronephthya gigantea TaxID=151771 RepID=UPI00106D0E9A|nr:ubiquinone biosynthesis protein COQ4 homolog, mitochondrial-like [Dendronephthya gigantea]